MDKLLIVDGSNLLFQMFFGMPARIVNGEGKAIQGTLGFVGALLKIIRKVAPTHILAVFDGEHENSRCEIDADYKANRLDYSMVNETENPFSQLPDVYKALDFMGIEYIETTNCEADDMMASYALSFCDSADIVICSFDSDFFQLISERISVLRYRGGKNDATLSGQRDTRFCTADLRFCCVTVAQRTSSTLRSSALQNHKSVVQNSSGPQVPSFGGWQGNGMRRTGRTPIDVNAASRQKTVLGACIPLSTEGMFAPIYYRKIWRLPESVRVF